ncbi:hypothetical protein [Microbacterium marinilacus]|uniref:Uncharacterized protein n=1 Tax=Microbacterium marinilacus TaxID=415209 RepID=A0ABP7BXN1_9MICO|nr:hypothetical protein [Microbacterium marinilacus]MBY0688177.1 hypothetical protein [Microbacterium marinilacus]
MAARERPGWGEAFGFATVVILAPWILLIAGAGLLPRLGQILWAYIWLSFPSGLVGALVLAVLVRRTCRIGTAPLAGLVGLVLVVAGLGAAIVLVAVTPQAGLMMVVLQPLAAVGLAAAVILFPGWMAAARFSAPLLGGKAMLWRRPRLGALLTVGGIVAVGLALLWLGVGAGDRPGLHLTRALALLGCGLTTLLLGLSYALSGDVRRAEPRRAASGRIAV